MIDYNLKDKIVLVTGAAGAGAGGTGFEIAKQFAKEGANVIMADINEVGFEREKELLKEGYSAKFIQFDLCDEDSIINLANEAKNWKGNIDILVNCAFFQSSEGRLADTPTDVWDRHFNINIRGNFILSKYIIPQMVEKGKGSIVNISSVASLVGEDGSAAYGCCKAAVNSLTRSIACQYGDKGIRCNAVVPGSILTEQILQYASQIPEMQFQFDMLKKHSLTGKYGNAQDVANMVLFLSSDLASNISAQLMVVDGGYSAQSAMCMDIHEYKKNHEWRIN